VNGVKRFFLACSIVGFVGCSQNAGSFQPADVTSAFRPGANRANTSADAAIYVADGSYRAPGSVLVIDTKSGNLVRTITNGVDWSRALTLDANGNLYVANEKGSSVTVYSPGSSTPALTITQDVKKPHGLQFDPAGELNVLNVTDVAVYEPGTGTLLRKLTNRISRAGAMTLDSTGDVFVLNYNRHKRETNIVEFAAGSSKVVRTFSGDSQFAYAGGLIIGPDGYLYVQADTNVIVLDPATGKIVRTITKGVYAAQTMAFDGVGNLYVASSGISSGPISVYAPGASVPSYEIDQSGFFANVLLFDASNDLYAVGDSSIKEFAPGKSQPKRTIGNPGYPWAADFGP
jgi:hypothetical protein